MSWLRKKMVTAASSASLITIDHQGFADYIIHLYGGLYMKQQLEDLIKKIEDLEKDIKEIQNDLLTLWECYHKVLDILGPLDHHWPVR